MEPAVSESVAPSRSSGKDRVDDVSSRTRTIDPFKNMFTAQRKETRTKKRWTLGRAEEFGGEWAGIGA